MRFRTFAENGVNRYPVITNKKTGREKRMTKTDRYQMVPVWKKSFLTLEEAAAYTNINITKIKELSDSEVCDFVLWNGTRRLLKRKKLEEFLENSFSI